MALHRNIATIDLNRCRVEYFAISSPWRRRFLGGLGLSAYLFCRHAPAACDALDEKNPVVMGAGLLVGTLSAPQGEGLIVSKSPQTGLMANDRLQGPFAAEMRQAGFDHLVVQGCAARPVVLFVQNGAVHIRDARQMSGKNPEASTDTIRADIGDREARVMVFDPAGDRSAGIVGVFAAKNIRAVACRGTLDIQVKAPAASIAFEGWLRTPAADSASVEPHRCGRRHLQRSRRTGVPAGVAEGRCPVPGNRIR